MARLKRILLVVLASLLFLIGLAWVFRFDIAAFSLRVAAGDPKAKYFSFSPEETLNRIASAIESDRLRLESIAFFQTGSVGQSDASTFLNALVSWSDKPGSLSLSAEIRALIDGPEQGRFWEAKPNWSQIKLDFSWFRDLHQFDHWSIDHGQDHDLLSMPLPKYSELMVWAKLRLLYGRDTNDLRGAFKDVRQLARLIMTNESQVAAMSTIALLKQEQAFFASLPVNSQRESGWQPLSQEDLKAARRYFWAQPAFLDMRLSESTFRKYSRLAPGLCQRVHEALSTSRHFRTLAEPFMRESYGRLDRLEKETRGVCRPSFVRRMWNNPDYRGFLESLPSTDAPEELAKLIPQVTARDLAGHPLLAEQILYLVLSVGEPSYLRFYDEPDAN